MRASSVTKADAAVRCASSSESLVALDGGIGGGVRRGGGVPRFGDDRRKALLHRVASPATSVSPAPKRCSPPSRPRTSASVSISAAPWTVVPEFQRLRPGEAHHGVELRSASDGCPKPPHARDAHCGRLVGEASRARAARSKSSPRRALISCSACSSEASAVTRADGRVDAARERGHAHVNLVEGVGPRARARRRWPTGARCPRRSAPLTCRCGRRPAPRAPAPLPRPVRRGC